jgi:hypothetical protein
MAGIQANRMKEVLLKMHIIFVHENHEKNSAETAFILLNLSMLGISMRPTSYALPLH